MVLSSPIGHSSHEAHRTPPHSEAYQSPEKRSNMSPRHVFALLSVFLSSGVAFVGVGMFPTR